MAARPLRVLGIGNVRSIHLLRWARTVSAAGHDVHLASDREPREDDPPTNFHAIRSLGLATRVPFARRAAIAPALGRLARRLDADVVHAHYLLPYGYWAARSGARPLVVSPWGTDALVHGQEEGRPRAEEAVRAADLVVVNSKALERASLELGAPAARIRNVLWHVDLDGFAPERADPNLRSSLGWPDDALVILSLRNFRPDTNIDTLVGGLRPLAEEEPRARLLLAGDTGPLRQDLEADGPAAEPRGPRRVPSRRFDGSATARGGRRRRRLHRQLRLDPAVAPGGDGLGARRRLRRRGLDRRMGRPGRRR